jgi:perosamine synthetase
MRIPALRLNFSQEDIRDVKEGVEEILSCGILTMGPRVEALEEAFCRVSGTRHAVAVSSGTAALEVILRALEVKGWDVLVPTNTFIATAVAVDAAGGRKVFVDASEEDLCLDVEDMARKLTPRTRAVIVVHIGGIITSRMADIQEFCRLHGLILIEDAAHAHGASFRGQPAGSLGHAAAFSFFPTKVVTSGEGGIITTDDDELARKARLLRSFGREDSLSNVSTYEGNNWRMSELNALVGLVHLRHLEENRAARARVADLYTSLLSDLPWARPVRPSQGVVSSHYKYTVLTELPREQLKEFLLTRGVACPGEVYRLPCHLQPVYRGAYLGSECPKAEFLCSNHLCLPLYPDLSREEVEYVAECLREAGKGFLSRRRAQGRG